MMFDIPIISWHREYIYTSCHPLDFKHYLQLGGNSFTYFTNGGLDSGRHHYDDEFSRASSHAGGRCSFRVHVVLRND